MLPLAARVTASLGSWLAGYCSDAELALEVDPDNVEALWRRLNEATFLTVDEKSAVAGYEALGPGHELSLKLDT